MALLLLAIFVIGAIASVRGRHDPRRHHGVSTSVVVQRRVIAVIAVLAALLLISMTL